MMKNKKYNIIFIILISVSVLVSLFLFYNLSSAKFVSVINENMYKIIQKHYAFSANFMGETDTIPFAVVPYIEKTGSDENYKFIKPDSFNQIPEVEYINNDGTTNNPRMAFIYGNYDDPLNPENFSEYYIIPYAEIRYYKKSDNQIIEGSTVVFDGIESLVNTQQLDERVLIIYKAMIPTLDDLGEDNDFYGILMLRTTEPFRKTVAIKIDFTE